MPKTFSYTKVFTLFDDDSSRRKLSLGADKWEVMMDDGRNPDYTNANDQVEEFLTIGKSYKITATYEELP